MTRRSSLNAYLARHAPGPPERYRNPGRRPVQSARSPCTLPPRPFDPWRIAPYGLALVAVALAVLVVAEVMGYRLRP